VPHIRDLARLAVPAALRFAVAAEAQIQDNSFLVEEAYNQEPGVVQHISTFERADEGSEWAFSFTQEWPWRSQKHQLSYTVPIVRLGDAGLGDVALNYRYQVLGIGGGAVAFAPRFSLLLPTGDEDEGLGAGKLGFEGNLPLSVELTENLVAHSNLGGSFTPNGSGGPGAEEGASTLHLGQSLIWLARPNFNLMLEARWETTHFTDGAGRSQDDETAFLLPGIRFAIDRPSGLQIVPGIAVPIGVGPSSGERGVFLYLSFEHPFGS
jgi:hypothetical protein